MSENSGFVRRNAWLWSVLTFAVGFVFGPGIVWQYAELRSRAEARADDRIRLERELYERLQVLANDVLSKFPRHFILRDAFFEDKEAYEQRTERLALDQKLVSLIGEYNRLEAKLARLENRKPRWFVVPVPRPDPPALVMIVPSDEPSPPAEGPTPERKREGLFEALDEDLKSLKQSEGLTEKP